VHAFLGRFIVFPSEAAHVATSLWTMHTHLISHWESTPRLALLSAEPESGKTRTLEILELLTPNAVAAVNAADHTVRRDRHHLWSEGEGKRRAARFS
jgi:hypothetical protein